MNEMNAMMTAFAIMSFQSIEERNYGPFQRNRERLFT